VASEDLLEANRERLRDDELVIVQGKVQPDRFAGGLRLNVNQVWDLPAARARFGKYLAVAVNGKTPPVADVIRTWPPKTLATEQGQTQQGLAIRLRLERQAVQAELDLGDAARFWPSDEALARWKTLAHEGRAAVVYE
jgi:DNA polymerase-3 subunit alpha